MELCGGAVAGPTRAGLGPARHVVARVIAGATAINSREALGAGTAAGRGSYAVLPGAVVPVAEGYHPYPAKVGSPGRGVEAGSGGLAV